MSCPRLFVPFFISWLPGGICFRSTVAAYTMAVARPDPLNHCARLGIKPASQYQKSPPVPLHHSRISFFFEGVFVSAAFLSWWDSCSYHHKEAPGWSLMGQNCRCRPQALACVIICYVWLLTADVLVLAKFSGRDNTVKKSLYVCPLQLAENPNGFSSKALKMSTKYLLVTIIFSSLHWDGWREFSPVVKSPKGGGFIKESN